MKHNYIRRNLLTTLIAIAIALIVLCGIIGVAFAQEEYAIATNDGIAYLTEEEFAFTNNDIVDNINVVNYANENYGKNTTLEWGSNKKIRVSASDDIVKFVPEYLFKEEGITQHLGREYGFYIETRKPLTYSDTLISTVILMKVDVTKDMLSDESRSHLKFRVEPIFQGDFAYVTRENKKICSIKEQEFTFFNDKYLYDVNVFLPAAGDEFVIPVPTVDLDKKVSIVFRQHNKYYLTNASNQTSLYNVNQPNPYDEDYSAEQDMGCFFSQSDFSYDGVFYKNGSSSMSDLGAVNFNAASLAFDWYDLVVGFKSVFKAIPIAGTVLSTIDFISDIASLEKNMRDTQVSESKKITYTPYYNNKDQQIANGGIRKDEVMAVVGQNDNLLFGTNNYFEFDYQIHCQDVNVDTRYATMLNIGVVSVVSDNATYTSFGDVHESTSVFSDEVVNNLKPNYKEIPKVQFDSINKKVNFNILPNNDTILELDPEFSGKYTVELSHNRYAKFSIYEASINEDGSINHFDKSRLVCNSVSKDGYAKSGEISLDSSKRYMMIADLRNQYRDETTGGRFGRLELRVKFYPKVVNIGVNGIELPYVDNYLEFHTTANEHYRFTINNSVITADLLDSNFNIIVSSVNGEILATLPGNTLYYLRINRSGNNISNVQLSIRDEMNVSLKNIDGINNSINENIIISSRDRITLPVPMKTGYNFMGWWTSLENYGKIVDKDNILSLARPELELFAKWSPIQYKVYYEENGGEIIPDGQYTIEQSLLLYQNIRRDGYIFCGWYDNSEFSGESITVQKSGIIGDRTYYARWVQDTFTVKLNVNSQFTDDIEANIISSVTNVGFGMAYTLPVPEHVGFTFEGWYKGNEKYTDAQGKSIHAYSDEHDVELTAKWVRKKFYFRVNIEKGSYVWLNSNLGELELTDNDGSAFEFNTGICPNCYITQLRINGFTCKNNKLLASLYREGHIFKAFVDNNIDKNVFCWDNINVSNIDGDIITVELYHEVEKEFKLHIENSSDVDPVVIEGDYGTPINFNKLPTKTGHDFQYFIVSNNIYNNKYDNTQFKKGSKFDYDTMQDLSVGSEQDGSIIYLEPYFTPKTYTVNFDNVPYNMPSKQVIYGEPYNVSSGNAFPIPTNLGYDFGGWYMNVNGVETKVVDEKGNINVWSIPNNCTLRAKWTLTKFVITYSLNGGTLPADSVNWFTMETATFSLPMPTKFGYQFNGWKSNGEIISEITKGTKTNISLIAEWKGIERKYTQAGEYTINDEVVIVNFGSAGVLTQMIFYIGTDVKEITFVGGGSVAKSYKSIIVNERTTPLYIRLKNVNILGHYDTPAIHAYKCKFLTLESVGANYLSSGVKTHSSSIYGALACQNIDIIGDELTILGSFAMGTDSGDGLDGDTGIYGGSFVDAPVMNIRISKLTVTGGNGYRGTNGNTGKAQTIVPGKAQDGKVGEIGKPGDNGGDGGDGGNGGYGIIYFGDINIASGVEFKVTGGKGGNGGTGGEGGQGGRGGEGGDGKFLLKGKEGGRGGNGGKGGDGGYAGSGGKAYFTASIIGQYEAVDGESGVGGAGGIGGAGGNGGLGGWTMKHDKRHSSGANGNKGAEGVSR